MQNRIKHALPVVFGAICLLTTSFAYANAILNIVPTSTSVRTIKLAATGSTNLIYTATNNTAHTLNQFILDPSYNTSGLTIAVQSSTCTGSLAPGASCTFGISVQGQGKTINTLLMPRVCAFNGTTCSVPVESNRIMFTTGGVGTSIAYIVNSAANGPVSICPINSSTGMLGVCTTSDGNGTFNSPQGLAINSAATFAYVTNYGGTTVSLCPILQDGTGQLGTCSTSTGNGTFTFANGAALNAANTILYVANNGNNTVSICPVINNGAGLGTCTTSDGDGIFNNIQSITLNVDGTFAYVCNDSNISICAILPNGQFGACTTSNGNGTFAFPQGISFSADNTTAYIGNFQNNTVSICPILQDGTGRFGTCTVAHSATFNFSANDVIGLYMSSPTFNGYLPNNGNNTVSICPINAAHALGNCSVASDPSFNQPTMIALSYVIS